MLVNALRPAEPSRTRLPARIRRRAGRQDALDQIRSARRARHTSILLGPPVADPGVTDDERRAVNEMMAKGTYGGILLATDDLDGTFERVQARAPSSSRSRWPRTYGVRDCAFRDPAGILVRIQERR
jgi:hypothetical protein